ncbi:MAG TPA: hypothetical protein VGA89_02740 [Patescibacteria group bacterium]|jgi:hypothetical protein
MNEKFNQNQTQFSVEEPLLEKSATIPSIELVTKKTRFPKWAWWLVIGLGLLLLVALATVWRNGAEQTEPQEEIVTLEEPRALSPLEQRLETAKQLLDNANPITQELPLPPVNMELRIDPSNR